MKVEPILKLPPLSIFNRILVIADVLRHKLATAYKLYFNEFFLNPEKNLLISRFCNGKITGVLILANLGKY